MAIAPTSMVAPSERAGWVPAIRAHAGFIVAEFLILVALLTLIGIVKDHPGPLPGEVDFTLEVQRIVRPLALLAGPITAVSTINRSLPAGIMTLVIVAIFVLRRRWLDIAVMLGTLLTAWVTNKSISEWIQRPRPGDFGGFVGRQIDVFSFPSGHVERALAFYGIVLFLTFQTRHRGAWLWLVGPILLAQIVLMPISRTLEGSTGGPIACRPARWRLLAPAWHPDLPEDDDPCRT